MSIGKLVTAGVVTFVVLVTSMMGCRVVPAGHVGVQTTLGAVHDRPLAPGVHWVKPWIDGVSKMTTQLKAFEVQTGASSKDLQIVTTSISVQHSLISEHAPATYSAIGDLDAVDVTIITPAVTESLKAITAHYTAEELITKRDEVKQRTVDAIQKFVDQTLKDKSIPGALHISNVAIKDFQFSREFNASIEAKVRAQQEALKAEQDKVKKITDATAKAKEVELAADAEAYEIEAISKERAAAIEREAKALAENPHVIQLRAIEKWSGNVPQFTGGGQVVPFLNVGPVVNK